MVGLGAVLLLRMLYCVCDVSADAGRRQDLMIQKLEEEERSE